MPDETKPPVFALTANGHMSFELVDDFGPVIEVIERSLQALDGISEFAVMVWRAPAGTEFVDVDTTIYPMEYMQTAGSAERCTTEIRRATASGFEHLVIGKLSGPSDETRIDQIKWNGNTMQVRITRC